ncbi:hypothetical protein RCL1_005903 [Eukaryota sp. TZLM3-RCL]
MSRTTTKKLTKQASSSLSEDFSSVKFTLPQLEPFPLDNSTSILNSTFDPLPSSIITDKSLKVFHVTPKQFLSLFVSSDLSCELSVSDLDSTLMTSLRHKHPFPHRISNFHLDLIVPTSSYAKLLASSFLFCRTFAHLIEDSFYLFELLSNSNDFINCKLFIGNNWTNFSVSNLIPIAFPQSIVQSFSDFPEIPPNLYENVIHIYPYYFSSSTLILWPIYLSKALTKALNGRFNCSGFELITLLTCWFAVNLNTKELSKLIPMLTFVDSIIPEISWSNLLNSSTSENEWTKYFDEKLRENIENDVLKGLNVSEIFGLNFDSKYPCALISSKIEQDIGNFNLEVLRNTPIPVSSLITLNEKISSQLFRIHVSNYQLEEYLNVFDLKYYSPNFENLIGTNLYEKKKSLTCHQSYEPINSDCFLDFDYVCNNFESFCFLPISFFGRLLFNYSYSIIAEQNNCKSFGVVINEGFSGTITLTVSAKNVVDCPNLMDYSNIEVEIYLMDERGKCKKLQTVVTETKTQIPLFFSAPTTGLQLLKVKPIKCFFGADFSLYTKTSSTGTIDLQENNCGFISDLVNSSGLFKKSLVSVIDYSDLIGGKEWTLGQIRVPNFSRDQSFLIDFEHRFALNVPKVKDSLISLPKQSIPPIIFNLIDLDNGVIVDSSSHFKLINLYENNNGFLIEIKTFLEDNESLRSGSVELFFYGLEISNPLIPILIGYSSLQHVVSKSEISENELLVLIKTQKFPTILPISVTCSAEILIELFAIEDPMVLYGVRPPFPEQSFSLKNSVSNLISVLINSDSYYLRVRFLNDFEGEFNLIFSHPSDFSFKKDKTFSSFVSDFKSNLLADSSLLEKINLLESCDPSSRVSFSNEKTTKDGKKSLTLKPVDYAPDDFIYNAVYEVNESEVNSSIEKIEEEQKRIESLDGASPEFSFDFDPVENEDLIVLPDFLSLIDLESVFVEDNTLENELAELLSYSAPVVKKGKAKK